MEEEKKNSFWEKMTLGCLPLFILLFLLPILLIFSLGGAMTNNKDCNGNSINAGGHIFAEDYVVLQGFGLTPFARANIGSLYGSIGHTGIDVQPLNFRDFSSEDVEVHTISDGTVISTGSSSIGGNYVLIDIGSGKRAYYGHLKKIISKQGDVVKKGEKIGIMGNTGTVVYHVHFEVQDTPGKLADKDSSPYLGKDVLKNGDIIRVSDKLETHVESSGKSNCSENNGKELVGSDTAEKIWNYFTSQGFSKEATAGVMGNLQQESGLNPEIVGSNGRPYGLAQWLGSRRTNLEKQAKEKGVKLSDIKYQLDFLIEEMKGINFGSKSFEDFKNIKDVSQAAYLFENYFERSGGSALANRLKFAESFYSQYK